MNLRRQASAIIQAGQTIDIHMLHLLSESSGGLVQDVMAVAHVSRRAGVTSLPLRLPKTSNPLVLVNGDRVQLAENNDLLLIPLPESGEECQVVVAWRESSGKTEQIQGERQLARLFVTQWYAPQCIHHLLIAPELDVRSQQAQFAVSEPTDILLILSRLLNRRPAEGSLQGPSIPPEIRRYVTRWQVAWLLRQTPRRGPHRRRCSRPIWTADAAANHRLRLSPARSAYCANPHRAA